MVHRIPRRSMLAGLAVGGAALPLLSACGSSASSGSSSSGSSSGGSGSSGSSGSAAGTDLVKASAVPVGGGVILAAQQLVVTQPTKGEFKGFSAICTHESCLVNSISGGEIHCPCHGSAFAITNGAVKGGPAPRPLPAEQVRLKGTQIVRG